MLESQIWSVVAALVVTGVVTTASLLLAGKYAPLPLFALLIALHTMLPVSKVIAIALAAIVTVAHIATSVVYKINFENSSSLLQVRFIY